MRPLRSPSRGCAEHRETLRSLNAPVWFEMPWNIFALVAVIENQYKALKVVAIKVSNHFAIKVSANVYSNTTLLDEQCIIPTIVSCKVGLLRRLEPGNEVFQGWTQIEKSIQRASIQRACEDECLKSAGDSCHQAHELYTQPFPFFECLIC